MSEPQEKVDISDLKDTFLECPVCVEHFNQTDRRPRLLHSCLHAFCTQCLHQLLQKEGKGQITCPLCRQVHKVQGKADTLPLDPVRGKLVDYVQIKHQKKVPCTDCPDGSDAQTRCQECSLYLCKDCTYVHKRHRLTNDHSVIPLDQVPEQSIKSFSKSHFCTHHPKHHLEFYCVTDESLCCISCTVLAHQGHNFQKVDEAVTSRQQELESSLQEMKIQAGELREKRQKEKQLKADIQKEQLQSENDVSRQFTKLVRMVNDRKTAILNEIDNRNSALLSLCQKNLAALDHSLAIIESTDNYFRQAKENSDAIEMLQMYPSLKRSLRGSTFETAAQKEKEDKILVKFVPSFVSTIEQILPETGCVQDVDETASSDKETEELIGFVNDVITKSLHSKSKDELLTKITEEKKTICSHCKSVEDKLRKTKCQHLLCSWCFDAVFIPSKVCPVCRTSCMVITGHMPPGTMSDEILRASLPGYLGFRTIKIRYQINDGIQTENHPCAGLSFKGTDTSAFLPDNPEGQKVLALLKVAWERRLTFGVKSVFWGPHYDPRGLKFCVDLCVSHKVNTKGGPYYDGYPDPGYLERVQERLAELGITEQDLQA